MLLKVNISNSAIGGRTPGLGCQRTDITHTTSDTGTWGSEPMYIAGKRTVPGPLDVGPNMISPLPHRAPACSKARRAASQLSRGGTAYGGKRVLQYTSAETRAKKIKRTSFVAATNSGCNTEKGEARIVGKEDPKATIAPRRMSERNICSVSAIPTPKGIPCPSYEAKCLAVLHGRVKKTQLQNPRRILVGPHCRRYVAFHRWVLPPMDGRYPWGECNI